MSRARLERVVAEGECLRRVNRGKVMAVERSAARSGERSAASLSSR